LYLVIVSRIKQSTELYSLFDNVYCEIWFSFKKHYCFFPDDWSQVDLYCKCASIYDSKLYYGYYGYKTCADIGWIAQLLLAVGGEHLLSTYYLLLTIFYKYWDLYYTITTVKLGEAASYVGSKTTGYDKPAFISNCCSVNLIVLITTHHTMQPCVK